MESTISRTEPRNRAAGFIVVVLIFATTASSYILKDSQASADSLLLVFLLSIAGILNLLAAILFGTQYFYNGKRYFALLGSAFLSRSLFELTQAILGSGMPIASVSATMWQSSGAWLWLAGESGFALFVALGTRSYLRTRRETSHPAGYLATVRYGLVAVGSWALTTLLIGSTHTDLAAAMTAHFGSQWPLLTGTALAMIDAALLVYVCQKTRLDHKVFLLVSVILIIVICEITLVISARSPYSIQWCFACLMMIAAPATAAISVILEITRQYQSLALTNTDLAEQVFVDPLTKIHNRRYFDVWAQQISGKAASLKTPLSLLLIDIDFFKQVNDRHGHPFGDAVLQRVAATILQGIPQPSHFAVRLGGEEFALILPDTDETTALRVSNRLRESVRQAATEMLPAHTVASGDAVTISVGIATWLPGTALNIDRMLSDADRALYEAKDKGRNQSVLSRYRDAISTA
ncbi:hypothetical protein PATSB16_32820 [Pandoraea thiooxydans]|uniref:GGDEF domain-containing protein n=1 Tax=Pandoraea thiooxydans TaxID=445709 RepID=UPI00069B4CEA|nr:GGDEF domain-containing protein [Pandoraea thiooxydans]ALX34809.2 hypothetical protein ABW99_20755 [Pandoraea thiooxydans]APR96618.1 hypothetical protein PATSB16_32820 [Pandoraea thiooxydans]